MVERFMTGAPEQRHWQNREIQGKLAQLVERRHLNPEIAGSNPALVNLSLFIKNVSKVVPSQFPLWFIT